MKYCVRCILPETHEGIEFDQEGVCSVCRQAEIKHDVINWGERRLMLDKIIDQYRDKGEYDCIVPFSGGKDSAFQLWYVVEKLKLKPLVVRYNHWGLRPIVAENSTKIFKTLGVDVVEFQSNWHVVQKLMRESLEKTGDFCWHCHLGVFANTLRLAVKFATPLIIFGESAAEYRSITSFNEIQRISAELFDKLINLGIDADTMYENLGGTIPKRDLMAFTVPTQQEMDKIGVTAIWLGDFIKWDTRANVAIIKGELGWRGTRVEGIPPEWDYEKIECKWQGIRDYAKYVKRGHGRTNHLACIDIRMGRMDRETGMKLYST